MIHGIKKSILRFCERSFLFSKMVSTVLYHKYRSQIELNQTLEIYRKTISDLGIPHRRMMIELFACKLCYNIIYSEYFMYKFYFLNDAGRRSFIGDDERRSLLNNSGTDFTRTLFDEKDLTYDRFKAFYKREAVKISGLGENEIEKYNSFVDNHTEFMVKPLNNGCGKGIYKVHTDSGNFSKEELYKRIIKDGGALLEEVISQTREMAEFHQDSVNTVRIATINQNGTIQILFSFLRFGRGGSVVDNAGAGGILASIDEKTGIVNSAGITEDMNMFLIHPDSGKQIIGFRVPEWSAAKELAKNLAREIPEHPCIGWDLALTKNGWVMVEGNRRTQFVGPQITLQKGCRNSILYYSYH